MPRISAFFIAMAVIAAPAHAGPRETLVDAAFATSDKEAAIGKVVAAEAQASALLARNPKDQESALQRAIATGYRAQLKRNLGDAKAARGMFEAAVAARPDNPEALIGLAGWHLEAIADAGAFLAGTMLGAKKGAGVAALDRAVLAGRGQPLFPAYAALMRIRLFPKEVARAQALAEAALLAAPKTALDRIMQRNARALLVPLRAGDGKAAAALAKKLLPFGRVG